MAVAPTKTERVSEWFFWKKATEIGVMKLRQLFATIPNERLSNGPMEKVIRISHGNNLYKYFLAIN